MNLTAYSDSESDGEAPPASKPAAKPAPRAPFHKVVDRANPGRIKVALPGAPQSQPHVAEDDIEHEAPPAKKPRLGGGGALGGFNAMLPAPKKPTATAAATAATGKRGLGKGLAAGINLKTGAEPAFKRASRGHADDYDESGNPIKKEPMTKEPMNKDDFRAMLNLPPPKTDTKSNTGSDPPAEDPQADAPLPKPAAPRFVPMSVGKGRKKKSTVPRPAMAPAEDSKTPTLPLGASPSSATEAKPTRKTNVSLFGLSQEAHVPATDPSDGQYQPLLHGTEDEDVPVADEGFGAQSSHQVAQLAPASDTPPNDLANIASELKLSEAERRQLFGKRGRGGPDFSSATIVDFNTDTEYAHNEQLRQQGEQAQHNPLKSISGTGKNSLRSLVSQATTQKDALEDHFASGRRNKREAGNRYGW